MSTVPANKFRSYVMNRFPEGDLAGAEEWRIQCPRCHNRDNKAFINLNTGRSQCKHCSYFTCDGWWSLVCRVEGLQGIASAQQWWEQHQSSAIGQYRYAGSEGKVGEHRRPMIRCLPKEFIPFDENLTNTFADYVCGHRIFKTYHERGIPEGLLEHYQMGYCESGKYEGRVIIPVINEEGLEFFFDRLVPLDDIEDDKKIKTLGIGSQQIYWPVKKSTVIFNIQRCRNKTSVNIAEGIFSALSINPSNTIALMGKECSGVQLIHLRELEAKTFHLYLDPDAKEKIIQLGYKLSGFGKDVVIHWLNPTIGDPNDYLIHQIELPKGEPWHITHELEGLRRGWLKRREVANI